MRRFLDRLYDGAGALGGLCIFLIFLLMIWAGMLLIFGTIIFKILAKLNE